MADALATQVNVFAMKAGAVMTATRCSEDSGLKEFAAVPDKSSDHTHSGSLDQSNPVGIPLVEKLTCAPASPVPGVTPENETGKINQSIETSAILSLEEGPLPAIMATLHAIDPLPLVGETWPASDLEALLVGLERCKNPILEMHQFAAEKYYGPYSRRQRSFLKLY